MRESRKPLAYYLRLYEDYLKGVNLSSKTIGVKKYYLALYTAYLEEKEIPSFRDVEVKDLERFAAWLSERESLRTGRPYSLRTVKRSSFAVCAFYRFLYRHNAVIVNPFEDFVFDVRVKEKRREIFSVDEMARFLDGIDIGEHEGLMTRAIFELMYSSGLRSMEVSNVQIRDIDLAERTALIRQGKGRKDRYVPFSDVVYYFLRRYMLEVRPAREKAVSERFKGYLFLTVYGNIKKTTLRTKFITALDRANIRGKNLTLHSIRHTCATHLLEAGADVRYVQELLGHEQIETTVKYTHLMIDNLKRIYKTYHPRENGLFEEIDEKYHADIDDFIEIVAKRRKRNSRAREPEKKGTKD